MIDDAPLAEIGDLIVVEEHRVGGGRRTGEILEVLGERERPHYRVRWDDDRETIFYPSSDAHVVHKEEKKAEKKGKRRKEPEEKEEPVLVHEP